MKKFFAGIAAAAIITVPMTSFALESMSKGALKKATGQAGVSIALDNVVIYQSSAPTVTYWDTDGVSKMDPAHTNSTIGNIKKAGIEISYGVNGTFDKLITIGSIVDGDIYGVTKMNEKFGKATTSTTSGTTTTTYENLGIGIYDGPNALMGGTSIDVTNGDVVLSSDDRTPVTNKFIGAISPLTIDVGTCQSLTQGLAYNVNMAKLRTGDELNAGVDLTPAITGATNVNVAGVVIGLPTVEVKTYHNKDIKTVSIVTDTTATSQSLNNHKSFIAIEKQGRSTLAILGGRLEIAPH